MDRLMVLLTIISVIAAAVLAFMTWRLRHQERRRAAARVAALASAIDAGLEPVDSEDAVPVSAMFETTPGAAVQARPLIRLGVGVVMAVVLIVAAAMSNSGAREAPPASADTVVQRGAIPLELISMRHAREGKSLVVSGLVRNPRAGEPVARLTAVVFAFDREGRFLTSGRALLDFMVLEPGDESPFVVTIPNVANAIRYRVTFRTDNGLRPHVDRRNEAVRLAATGIR